MITSKKIFSRLTFRVKQVFYILGIVFCYAIIGFIYPGAWHMILTNISPGYNQLDFNPLTWEVFLQYLPYHFLATILIILAMLLAFFAILAFTLVSIVIARMIINIIKGFIDIFNPK